MDIFNFPSGFSIDWIRVGLTFCISSVHFSCKPCNSSLKGLSVCKMEADIEEPSMMKNDNVEKPFMTKKVKKDSKDKYKDLHYDLFTNICM